jgi:hypothetical protein
MRMAREHKDPALHDTLQIQRGMKNGCSMKRFAGRFPRATRRPSSQPGSIAYARYALREARESGVREREGN